MPRAARRPPPTPTSGNFRTTSVRHLISWLFVSTHAHNLGYLPLHFSNHCFKSRRASSTLLRSQSNAVPAGSPHRLCVVNNSGHSKLHPRKPRSFSCSETPASSLTFPAREFDRSHLSATFPVNAPALAKAPGSRSPLPPALVQSVHPAPDTEIPGLKTTD